MADEQPGKDEDVTPKGAVEVDESDLDQAAGGTSFAYAKVEITDKDLGQPAPLVPGVNEPADGHRWKI